MEPSRNRIWCILALKLTNDGNNFNDFPENYLTEFHAVHSPLTLSHNIFNNFVTGIWPMTYNWTELGQLFQFSMLTMTDAVQLR